MWSAAFDYGFSSNKFETLRQTLTLTGRLRSFKGKMYYSYESLRLRNILFPDNNQ